MLMGALRRVRRSVGGAPIHVGLHPITLLFLITGLHVAHGRLGVIVEPAAPVSGGAGVQTAPRPGADATGNTDAMAIVNAVFRGIGQLFFLNSILAGVLIIVGIAFCSRIAAIFALTGSIVGMLTGMALGADGGDLQRSVGFQLVRRGARDRRRVLCVDLALSVVGRRVCGVYRVALRCDRLILRAVGPARADAALLLRNVGLVLLKDASRNFTRVAPAEWSPRRNTCVGRARPQRAPPRPVTRGQPLTARIAANRTGSSRSVF